MSDEKQSRPIQTWSPAKLALLHGLLWIVCVGVMWKIVPAFEKIFVDFEADMPAIAVLAITYSNLAIRWFLVIPFIAALWGGDLIVLNALGHDPKNALPRRLWLALMLLVPLGLTALTILAMFLPLIGTIEALS